MGQVAVPLLGRPDDDEIGTAVRTVGSPFSAGDLTG